MTTNLAWGQGGEMSLPEDGIAVPGRENAIRQSRINAAERLIVALDVPSIPGARDLVNRLGDSVSFYKVGLFLQMLGGTEYFTDELIKNGKRVFVDYKWTDIPQSVRGGVLGAAGRGVHFITIQGNGDVTEEMLKAAVGARDEATAAGKDRVKLFFVTVLTSLADRDLQDMGYRENVRELVRRRARLAKDVGLDGVIASGQEAKMIKEEIANGGEFEVVTPGVRPAGQSADDHKRPTTPYDAISEGADYLVVGRPIVQADDPLEAAESIIREMQEAFDSR